MLTAKGAAVSTFKIKLKVTGFELEVEGSRDEIPAITASLGKQLTGLITPSAALAAEVVTFDMPATSALAAAAQGAPINQKPTRARRKSASKSAGEGEGANSPIDLRVDSSVYGAPKQAWSTAKKSMWLLHVLGANGGPREVSGGVISATFAKHYKQAGLIQSFNVNRDLGKLKIKSSNGRAAAVGEDTTKTPPLWFLTDEGTRQALELVADALGRGASSGPG